GVREVARRRAGDRLETQLLRLRRRDGHDPVLERVRRVRGVELDQQLADAERGREPGRRDERCEARRESLLLRGSDRQEGGVAPDRRWAGLDPLARGGARQLVAVVDGVERPEAPGTGPDRFEGVLGVADATAQRYGGHCGNLLVDSLNTSLRVWHLARVEQVVEASQGRSLSLS